MTSNLEICFYYQHLAVLDNQDSDAMEKLLSFILNYYETVLFSQDFFFAKFTAGHVGWRFENTAEKLSAKIRVFFSQAPKRKEKTRFFMKKNFPQMFLRTGRIQYWEHCTNFCYQNYKTFEYKLRKCFEIVYRFQRKTFFHKIFLRTSDMQFSQLPRKKSIGAKNFRWKFKNIEGVVFSQKDLFPQNLTLDTWNELQKTSFKIYANFLNSLDSSSYNIKWKSVLSEKKLKKTPGCIDWTFDNIAESFPPKTQKVFDKQPNFQFRKCVPFEKTIWTKR